MTPPPILPRVARFEGLGFGLFVHWGLYSERRTGEWVWHHHRIPRADYLTAQARFKAEGFDARALVRLARRAGCRYVCHTARHHEGFSLYDMRGINDYDSLRAPAGRDLIREFSDACEAEGMAKFFYHTTLDWWHPDFDAPGRWPHYLAYLRDSVERLCTRYGRVDGLWFDGNWSRRDRDWREGELYAMIRRHQPDCIIVNNSSVGALGAEGHPEVDVRTFEQGRPTAPLREGKPKHLAAEMCDTVNSHWGIAGLDFSQKPPAEIIRRLAACRRFRANYLLNVGPEPGGTVTAYDQALLEAVGHWIALCPEAVYDAAPTELACAGDDFVLRRGDVFFYFCHGLPIWHNMHLAGDATPGAGLKTILGALPPVRRIAWADNDESLPFTQDSVPAGGEAPPGGRAATACARLTFQATPHPYGRDLVVRIARIETHA